MVLIGRILFTFVIATLSISLWSVQKTFAVENVPPTKGLTMSPLRVELEIEPGRSLDRTVKLINYSDSRMDIHMSAEKFSVIDQNYDYAFNAESDTAKWINFAQDDIQLESGKSVKVPYTIGVPANAEPGGRYLSLFATTDARVGDNGVQTRQRVASLLYITVKGDVTRSGQVVSLTSPWLVSGPDAWNVVQRNTGTTHYRSRYTVTIKNPITNETAASSSGDALILPGTVRLVTSELPVPELPGVYKVDYLIGLGDTPAVTITRYLVYLPQWAMAVGIIAITIFIIWTIRKLLRKKIK